jgi:putative endonuclease
MSDRNDHGALGEHMACLYLVMRGMRFVDRRFRIRGGEIDLVMAQSGVVIFVEVKTRVSAQAPLPEERVSRAQLRRLRRAAGHWLRKWGQHEAICRFDVVTVDLGETPGEAIIRHFPQEVA